MSESVPPLASEILYNNTSGQTAGNSGLTIDTQYLGSRLESQNLLVQNITNLTGNVGIRTATARQALEVTGNTILTAQGTASQDTRQFGLNGTYDTLSLVSPVGLGLNGTTSIFFGLNSVIYYPVARIAAVDNGNYSGSLEFQIGNGQKLYKQMLLNTSGIIIANGAFLHSTVNLPTPGTNICLNFPSVSRGSTSIIDVYFTLQRCDSTFTTLDSGFINMAKCTVFLGNQLYVTGISIQNNGSSGLIIKPNGIKATGSKVTLTYSDALNPYVATVNYMVYGPAAEFISSIETTLNDSGVSTAPGIPMEFSGTPLNNSVLLNWSEPSNGGSGITGYTISTSGYSVNSSGVLVSDPLGTLLIPYASVPTTDITVTGLTNGTTYTFTIKAMNSIGYSGTASIQVTPAVVPAAPTAASGTPGNGSATLTWTAPTNTGGSAIRSYLITWSPPDGQGTTTSVSPPAIITGLTNGTSYTFNIYATNSIGNSVTYATTSPITPKSAPDAATITSVTAGYRTATVNWTTPASNGGSTILSYKIIYTITSVIPNTTTTMSAIIGVLPVSTAQTTVINSLLDATSYTFNVVVTSSAGDSPLSNTSLSVSTFSVPGVPTGLTGTSGVNLINLSWAAPTSTGGSDITGYKIYDSSGNLKYDGSGILTRTATISPLLKGSLYSFTVTAINIVGESNRSSQSAAVSTSDVPGAPTGLTGTAGVNSINLSWTVPTITGGTPITGYRVYDSSGNLKYDGSGNILTTGTVTGLSKATAYTFTVSALNILGESIQSSASSAVTTYDVPGVPTTVTATGGSKSATIRWLVPATTGGSPVTGYRIYDSSGIIIQYDGSGNVATTASVTGLTDGTTYNYLVKAMSLVGESTGVPISVTTYDIPGPPTGLTAVSANASVTLSWVAPTNTGNTTVLGYKVYDSSGNIYNSTTNTFVSDSSGTILTTSGDTIATATLTGLVNGKTYVFTIKTNNALTDSVAATFPSIVPGLPGAPTNLFAISGNASANLSWLAPTFNGGNPITGYRVKDSSGNVAYDGSGNVATSKTITGLVNGQMYTYTVQALNANGISELSSEVQVTIGYPGTPLNLTATPGDTSVTLTWSAPSSPGGSAITSYGIPDSSGNLITISSPIQLTGLTNGTQYTLTIYAVNSFGISSVPASISVIPGLPSAPTNLTAVASDAEISLNWSAPSGTLTPTGYRIYDASGTIQYDGSGNVATSARISGLTNGTIYSFLVYSVNANGNSSTSASISIRPFTVPGAPGNLYATAASTSVTLNWSAPSANGASIIGYKVYDSSGNIYNSSGTAVTDTGSIYSTTVLTSYTITGLTTKSYTFTVKAANSAGNSLGVSISVTPGTPGTPTNLTAVPSSGSVVLSWSAPSGSGLTYKIVYAGITVSNISTTTSTITGLANGSQYTFAVYATNASGADSITPALISAIPGLPFAPTNLTGYAGSGSVTLNWSAPSSGPTPTGYQITLYTTTVVVTATTATITGLTTGTSYTFTVNSQNAVGNSVGSATISVISA